LDIKCVVDHLLGGLTLTRKLDDEDDENSEDDEAGHGCLLMVVVLFNIA
jgi:hypothetical protein